MAWAQVPPPWWSELDSLTPGKTSGLIADRGDRYWVVKVIERKQNPAMTFAAAAAAIDATLRARKFEERREAAMKALRAKAKLEVSSGSAAEAAR